jgi:hypothetical protein
MKGFILNFQAVLGRWVEVDQVITVCAMKEKGDKADKPVNIADTEHRINCIIRLKHVLSIVTPLLHELAAGNNQLFKDLAEVHKLNFFLLFFGHGSLEKFKQSNAIKYPFRSNSQLTPSCHQVDKCLLPCIPYPLQLQRQLLSSCVTTCDCWHMSNRSWAHFTAEECHCLPAGVPPPVSSHMWIMEKPLTFEHQCQ